MNARHTIVSLTPLQGSFSSLGLYSITDSCSSYTKRGTVYEVSENALGYVVDVLTDCILQGWLGVVKAPPSSTAAAASAVYALYGTCTWAGSRRPTPSEYALHNTQENKRNVESSLERFARVV